MCGVAMGGDGFMCTLGSLDRILLLGSSSRGMMWGLELPMSTLGNLPLVVGTLVGKCCGVGCSGLFLVV